MADEINNCEAGAEIPTTVSKVHAEENFTQEETKKLVSFFHILIEIDQNNKRKVRANENKNI